MCSLVLSGSVLVSETKQNKTKNEELVSASASAR